MSRLGKANTVTSDRGAVVIVPTVSVGGSTRDQLVAQIQLAVDSLQVLVRVLGSTTPHARDYHAQGNEAFVRAKREHQSRIERIVGVDDELRAILRALSRGRA